MIFLCRRFATIAQMSAPLSPPIEIAMFFTIVVARNRLTETNVLPIFEKVIREGKLRVLVYNGDTDPGEDNDSVAKRYSTHFSSCKSERPPDLFPSQL